MKKLSKIVRLTDCQKNELKIYDRFKAREFTGIDNLWGIHPFFIPKGKNGKMIIYTKMIFYTKG